jgi:hypothetical protein
MERRRVLQNAALTDPRFWAMHYYLLIGTDEVDSSELVEPIFGVSNQAVNEYFLDDFDGTGSREIRQYVEVPIHNGFSVQVEYAGEPDSEIRLYLNHNNWPHPECVGFDSGHFALPAFRWCEVKSLYDAAKGLDAARALLLMFPGVYVTEEDKKEQVQSTLVDSWAQLHVADIKRLEETSKQIIDYRLVQVRWWQDPQFGWITDGQYSFRNPNTLMTKFAHDRFARVREFFAGIENLQ